MEGYDREEVKSIVELSNQLSSHNVTALQRCLNIPRAIVENVEDDSYEFLYALKNWEKFDPASFLRGLDEIGRADLKVIAKKISWISKRQIYAVESQPSTKSLLDILRSELGAREWKMIMREALHENPRGRVEFEEAFKVCMKRGLITKSLDNLCDILNDINRQDLVMKMNRHKPVFHEFSEVDFQNELMSEFEEGEIELDAPLDSFLRLFLKIQHQKVSVTFEGESTESMETIYTPLTVVEEVPELEGEAEESSLTEIDNIRAMVKRTNMKTVTVVDFDTILTSIDVSNPKLFVMIGSPGSGKTFLCKNIAYKYGTSELPTFQFVLYIPCRSEKWHEMEATRHEKEQSVNKQFLQEWLAISMSSFAKWSDSLSKRLVATDGDSLLVILDGADEFVKTVPFLGTLLALVLQRSLLSRASFLVTSRPGAWSQLSHQHGATFRVDSHFQVVGFSPANRDAYFEKRIRSEQKLSAVRRLLRRHDEVNQLALVPVNASLFCSLFSNQSTSSRAILSFTLTHLYSELVVYMVRRQLSRMGLKEYALNVSGMSDFHPGIQACIQAIGEEAYNGVFDRHLTSSKAIPLVLDDEVEVASERLGLMESCLKEVKSGQKETVWTFTHLSIQEFMSALFFCANRWTHQCAMTRYLVSSSEYFAMFKMVIRFSCGILKERTGAIIPILCRKLTPTPMPMHEMPMLYQLHYDTTLVKLSDWNEFTATFIMLATIICETTTETISKHFCDYYDNYLPDNLCFYFRTRVVSPNEWYCFVQSLSFINKIHLIYINTRLIAPNQFSELLRQLSSWSIFYLALGFLRMKTSKLRSYTRILSSVTLPRNTKISIYLAKCDLTMNEQLFPTNQFVGSLGLRESKFSSEMLHQITNQFSEIENLYYWPASANPDWSILHRFLTVSHQVTGLLIVDRNSFLSLTPDSFTGLSSVQELYYATKLDPFSLLPFLLSLSGLTHLLLFSTQRPPYNESHRDKITQLINNNHNTLRALNLPLLNLAGFHSWSSLLPTLHSCSELVYLTLSNTDLPLNDIICWYATVNALSSLVDLTLAAIPLQDEGLWIVCHSLTYHPNLRGLWIAQCQLSSASCRTLMCLIQTLPRFRELRIDKAELFRPNFHLQRLIVTAQHCSVKIEFR